MSCGPQTIASHRRNRRRQRHGRQWPLAGFRQRRMTGPRHLRAFKTFIYRESEHERIARSEAAFELAENRRQALIQNRLVFQRVGVAFGRRPGFEFGDDIRPFVFGAIALPAHALDAVTNLRAAVGINRVFDGAFIVINEQARRREIGNFCFIRSNSMAPAMALAVQLPSWPWS